MNMMNKAKQAITGVNTVTSAVSGMGANKPPPGVTIEPKFDGLRVITLEGSTIVNSRIPFQFVCPHCNFMGKSDIARVYGNATWFFFLLLLCTLFFLAFIPLCFDICRDFRHLCPHCQRSMGKTRAFCDDCFLC